MAHLDKRAIDVSSTQGGVLTRSQALELGFSNRQIDYRLSVGRWQRVGDLGYRLIPVSDPRQLLQASTILIPDAVVSHGSASFIHGIEKHWPERPSISVHSRTTHALPDVEVHRCHDLLNTHVTQIEHLRVTTPERTIFDLASTYSLGRLSWAVVHLATEGRVFYPALEKVVAEIGRRGKPGTARMRELLESLDLGESDGSPLERRGRRLLDRAQCPCGFESEYPIPWSPRRRFDDAFPSHRLAVEWDSLRFHGQRDAFEADRHRDRSALEHGWRVLRFTWVDVTETPDRVVQTVRRMLDCRVRSPES